MFKFTDVTASHVFAVRTDDDELELTRLVPITIRYINPSAV